VLVAAALAGGLAAPALGFARGARRSVGGTLSWSVGETLSWSLAVGAALVAASVPLSLAIGLRPGWPMFLVLTAGCAAAGRLLRVAPPAFAAAPTPDAASDSRARVLQAALALVILAAAAAYMLRALTEPMWANDYLAIWGLKGKTIYGAEAVPRRLFADPELGFSHPEYPLGLPFLYAGLSFLAGRWDDHALALLFPVLQWGTLAALSGWLRRRGASLTVALAAAALVASFEPLYSAFLTGMGEVPLAFGLVLFGTALADALDAPERRPGALRRLAVASAWIAATKNEGLFFAAAGCAIGLALGGRRRWKVALAALPTALVIQGLHVAWRGRLPLRDFDFGVFAPARLGEALSAAWRVAGGAGLVGVALLAALVALGADSRDSRTLLALALCGAAAYLVLPAFAVRGPEWMITTTLPRTAAALGPLVAAGVAVRYATARTPS
jgi:hypothetical protein